MSLSICTFNVNSIRSRVDLIARWLTEKREIDILCMQEIKCEEKNFPFKTFKSLGYECVINGEKRLNGVAICSKLPIDDVKTFFDNEILDTQKRLIQATIQNIVILCCYIPRGGEEGDEKHKFKMKFYDALSDYTKTLLQKYKKVCLLGDFNVALTDIDVYDTKVFTAHTGFLPSEKEKMSKLLDAGLKDCYRQYHPKEKAFTWWDYRTAGIWRDEGMRIDYILSNDMLCKSCKSIEVDLWTRRRRTPTPSDHAPIVAEF